MRRLNSFGFDVASGIVVDKWLNRSSCFPSSVSMNLSTFALNRSCSSSVALCWAYDRVFQWYILIIVSMSMNTFTIWFLSTNFRATPRDDADVFWVDRLPGLRFFAKFAVFTRLIRYIVFSYILVSYIDTLWWDKFNNGEASNAMLGSAAMDISVIANSSMSSTDLNETTLHSGA